MLTQPILALPTLAIAGLVVAFFLGGIVKGVVGIGLPLVLVPLVTQVLDIPVAVALLTVPMIATNIGQAAEGGHTLAAVRGVAPVLATLALGTLVGAHLLLSIDRKLLNTILGVCFVLLATVMLSLPKVRLRHSTDRWAGPLVGLGAGILGGMSSMFGPPIIVWLVGRGTDPNTFVKRMAIFAFSANVTLLLAIGSAGSLTFTDLAISAVGIFPIQAGMPVGRWLRKRIKPAVFRIGVLVLLAAGGLDLLRHAWM